jgi:hypothetical protein
MSALSARLHDSMFSDCHEAAKEIDWLEEQLSIARQAAQAMLHLQQAALIRGYDSLASAIEAAPLRSAGYQQF